MLPISDFIEKWSNMSSKNESGNNLVIGIYLFDTECVTEK